MTLMTFKCIRFMNIYSMSGGRRRSSLDAFEHSSFYYFIFFKILHYELMRDDAFIQNYNSNCLEMSSLTTKMRAILFDWLIRVRGNAHTGLTLIVATVL